MTISAILNKAADLIERNGWCRGSFSARPIGIGMFRKIRFDEADETCAFCADGAIRFAAGHNDHNAAEADSDVRAALKAFSQHVQYLNPASWNDMDGRTKHEVVNTLRQVAQKVE